MGIFSKIFKQTSWQVLGKVVTSLSTFIILGLVTRNYGKEGTGIFTLALTYLAIFYLLADFGLNAHVIKEVQSVKGKVQSEWQKLLGTRLAWSAVLVVLAVASLPFWPFANAEFSQAVLFGSLAIIASSIYVTCNLIFQSKLRYDLSVISSSIGTFISLGLFIFLVYSKASVSFLLLAHLFSWLMIALVALFLVRKYLTSIFPISDKQYAINLLKDSWPIAATLTLNVVYFRADSFLLAYFKTSSEVGIYNVAYSVFQSALVLPTFIMNAYYPLMLKSLNKIKLVGFGLLVLAALGTILTLILAPFIIKILTGEGFDDSVVSLQILSLGFPAFFLSSLLMWVLVTKGQYKNMLYIYTLGISTNIFLNLFYIPKYSFLAASWITVVSEYFILLLQIMVIWSSNVKENSKHEIVNPK